MSSDVPNATGVVAATEGRRWKPLSARARRVLGVLIEKAKTTPDQYPMSLNALRVGANQKSNRYPLMEIDEDDVSDALEELKLAGAAVEVLGSGRVARFRHQAYEWLGVDKVELAVMAELLLRGTQTEGELRGRAARMEPLADLSALRAVLGPLKGKELVVGLSPEGRGHLVTHALYQPQELDKVRAEAGRMAVASVDEAPAAARGPVGEGGGGSAGGTAARGELTALRVEVEDLRGALERVRTEVSGLREELEALRRALGE